MPRKKTEKLVHLDMEILNKPEQPLEKSTSSLGELLRARRSKKRWEIEDVARKLRIKSIYLEALEKGHYYAFPARSSGVGFLRSYSKLLDLNADEMISLFNQETSDVKEQPLDMLVMEKHFTLPSMKLILIVLCIIFGVYLVYLGAAVSYYSGALNQINFLPENTEKEKSLSEQTEVKDSSVLSQEVREEQTDEFSKTLVRALPTFVATNTVWVGLKNVKTGKMIVSKKFQKSETFTPETPLEDLAISTGRPNALELHTNGRKVRTFGRETWLSLAGFNEVSLEKDKE